MTATVYLDLACCCWSVLVTGSCAQSGAFAASATTHNQCYTRSIRALTSALTNGRDEVRRLECQWQRAQLPDEIQELVLDDRRERKEACWSLFQG